MVFTLGSSSTYMPFLASVVAKESKAEARAVGGEDDLCT